MNTFSLSGAQILVMLGQLLPSHPSQQKVSVPDHTVL